MNKSKTNRLDNFRQEKLVALIKFGHPRHVNKMLKHKNAYYRATLAIYGTEENRSKLMNDKNPEVREAIADYTTDYNKANKLTSDDNSRVRSAAMGRLQYLGYGRR